MREDASQDGSNMIWYILMTYEYVVLTKASPWGVLDITYVCRTGISRVVYVRALHFQA